MKGIVIDPDTSVDIWFGPTASAGHEANWVQIRCRNRHLFERPIKIKKLKLTPYGAAEALWDQRYKSWSQFKFTGGVQIHFIRRSSFDLFYERQHSVTCADPHTNTFGLDSQSLPSAKK